MPDRALMRSPVVRTTSAGAADGAVRIVAAGPSLEVLVTQITLARAGCAVVSRAGDPGAAFGHPRG